MSKKSTVVLLLKGHKKPQLLRLGPAADVLLIDWVRMDTANLDELYAKRQAVIELDLPDTASALILSRLGEFIFELEEDEAKHAGDESYEDEGDDEPYNYLEHPEFEEFDFSRDE